MNRIFPLLILVNLVGLGAGCSDQTTNERFTTVTPGSSDNIYQNSSFTDESFTFNIPDGWEVTEEDQSARLVLVSDPRTSNHITVQMFAEDPTDLIESHMLDPIKTDAGIGRDREGVQLTEFEFGPDFVIHTVFITDAGWFVVSSAEHNAEYKEVLSSLETL